jgi:NADH-quinone oxidoreductase subunit A
MRFDSKLSPLLVLLILAGGIAGLLLMLATVIGPKAMNTRKALPFECGNRPLGPRTQRVSVKFYLVAMLFILFDIEIVFMYPWAVVYRDFLAQHGSIIFWSMAGFVSVLTFGYIYAIKKGALDWRS